MLCAWLATHRLIPSDHPAFLVVVAMRCPLTTSTDYACTESCLLNDLNTVESPPLSDQLFETASMVADENIFANGGAHGEEDNSASNKATEAAGVGLMYDDEQ